MFRQLEYSEILFRNSPRLFKRCTDDEDSTYNDFLPVPPSGKVSDAQQVIIFVNTFKNTFSNQ